MFELSLRKWGFVYVVLILLSLCRGTRWRAAVAATAFEIRSRIVAVLGLVGGAPGGGDIARRRFIGGGVGLRIHGLVALPSNTSPGFWVGNLLTGQVPAKLRYARFEIIFRGSLQPSATVTGCEPAATPPSGREGIS